MIQKLTHQVDSHLTQEAARMALVGDKVQVVWFTNHENKQSVVHSHPYHEIILPITGSNVQYAYAGSLLTAHPGEMVFFPADMFHSGKYDLTDDISERIIVQIDANLWDKALVLAGLGQPAWVTQAVTLDADYVAAWNMRGLFERMAQSPYLSSKWRDTVLVSQLCELQLLIQQSVDQHHTGAPGATSALVARAVHYLEDHYTDPDLTTAALAQYAYTSREHLSRAFKEYTSESIHSYLTNLRMQHCRRAMLAGKSVLDACTESGFSNYSSFLKSFRRLYGVTPADYKKQLKAFPQPTRDLPDLPPVE